MYWLGIQSCEYLIKLPLAIVAVIHRFGLGQHSLALLGLLMGIMGLTANFIRRAAISKARPAVVGMRGSVAGWLLIAGGAGAGSGSPASAPLIIAGVILLQVFARLYGANFMEDLRMCATGVRHRTRRHRKGLQRYMISKTAGATAGCLAVAVAPVAFAPAILVALSIACLAGMEKAGKRLGEPSDLTA